MFRRLRRNVVLVLRFPAHVSFGSLDPFQNLSLHHSTLNRKLLFPKSQKILSAPHSTFRISPIQPNSPSPTRTIHPNQLTHPNSPSIQSHPCRQTDAQQPLTVGFAEHTPPNRRSATSHRRFRRTLSAKPTLTTPPPSVSQNSFRQTDAQQAYHRFNRTHSAKPTVRAVSASVWQNA